MTLTSADVRATSSSTRRWRTGYDVAQVNAALIRQRVRAMLLEQLALVDSAGDS